MPTSRRSRFVRGPKPKYLWHSVQIGLSTNVVANQTSVLDLLSGLPLAVSRAGLTVIRSILDTSIEPAVFGNRAEWYQGLFMVERDALAAGAVPELGIDDANYLLNTGQTFISDVDAGPREHKDHFDIRTARKLRSPAHTIIHMIRNTAAAAALNYFLTGRLLLRLP